MDFLDAMRVLRRQAVVVVIGAILTLLGGAYAFASAGTEYQATAQYLLLLPSQSTGHQNPTNPYLNLNSGLGFAASLIASDMTTKDAARSLVRGGYKSDYTVALGPSEGPMLQVVVHGTDRRDVLQTRNELLRRFDAELHSIQAIPGIPPNQVIFSRSNAVDPVPEVVPGNRKKALVLVVAVGLVATVVVAFVVDRFAARKGRRQEAHRLRDAAA